MLAPAHNAVRNRLKTNVTCPARETADRASWLIMPSITASDAPTKDSINCEKAIGSTKDNNFL